MPSQDIEGFAQLLIHQVRDAAIHSLDGELHPGSNSPTAKRWRNALDESLPVVIIPDCVDHALFYLLRAIDEGGIPLSFSSNSGKKADLVAEGFGELSGWLVCTGGWRENYSKERYADDNADLA
jgi:hypothetical protein